MPEDARLVVAIQRILDDQINPHLPAARLTLINYHSFLPRITRTSRFPHVGGENHYERVLVRFYFQEEGTRNTHFLNLHLWRFAYTHSAWRRGDYNKKSLKKFFQRFGVDITKEVHQ